MCHFGLGDFVSAWLKNCQKNDSARVAEVEHFYGNS